MARYLLFCLFLALNGLSLKAQVQDDFEDGNFTASPVWTGDTAFFVVNAAGELQSNGPDANQTLHLATDLPAVAAATWQIQARYAFPPSNNNRIKWYLSADQADLEGPLNGYFVALGEGGSNDAINLYRQDGNLETLLIQGRAGTVAAGFNAALRVSRTEEGTWELAADTALTGTFIQEGAIADTTYRPEGFTGVWVQHSSTRSQSFFFDNLTVEGRVAPADTLSPVVERLTLISSKSLDVRFSEAVDPVSGQNSAHYAILETGANPQNAARDTLDPALVHLIFTANFPVNRNLSLVVTQVKDLSGNTMVPDTLAFAIDQVSRGGFKDVILTEIMADPTPVVGLPEAEFVELFNRSEEAVNLNGWTFGNDRSTGTLPAFVLDPGSYVIVTSNANAPLFESLGAVVAAASFPSLVNGADELGLRNADGLLIDTVNYEVSWYGDAAKDDGGFTLELINPGQVNCPERSNWTASAASQGGTPGQQNSVFSTAIDGQPPVLAASTLLGPDSLQVCFNEAMDPLSLLEVGNYSFSPALNLENIRISDAGNTCVVLRLSSALSPGQAYALTISGVQDCSGNPIAAPIEVALLLGESAQAFDVVINEIFADPTPQVSLPDAEYVELYNRSDKSINLQGWRFGTDRGMGQLPAYTLEPGAYVILTRDADVPLFQTLGAAISPSSWQSLVNGGDELGLRDGAGMLIDTVNYDDGWYQDPAKSSGGYSLERIHPDPQSCPEISNWRASVDPSGGTPGRENSLFSNQGNTQPPVAIQVNLITQDSLQVCFDESMDPATLAVLTNYTLTGGPGVTAVIPQGPEYFCAKLALDAALEPGNTYTLNVSGVADCSGNVSPDPLTTQISLGAPSAFQDVIINELMADETPTQGLPEVEYVELFNRSDKTLNLEGWTFGNDNSTGTLPAFLLSPQSFVILVKSTQIDSFASPLPVIAPSSWSGLANTGDELGLRNAQGELIDTVAYTRDWYADPDKEDGGYALERVNPDPSDCPPIANWRASIADLGGTPGTTNSVFNNSIDATPPQVLSARQLAPDTLLVCFDESMDFGSLSNPNHYQLDSGDDIRAAIPVGPAFDCVKLAVETVLVPGESYILGIQNVQDCSGNLLEGIVTREILVGGPARAFEVVINEIMADESPLIGLPEGEFVEIYNRTDRILDISGWGLRDPSGTRNWGTALILPRTYLIICADDLADAFSAFGEVLAVSSLPSLGNSNDSLYLVDPLGFEMDYLFYDQSWYGDDAKDDGGWTLERIDPDFVNCNNPGNWRASVNPAGGTPGQENSVIGAFTDTLAPQLSGIRVLDEVTLELLFDEQMDANSLEISDNYVIDQGIGNPLLALPVGPTYTSVQLLLDGFIEDDRIYELTFSGLADCAGNAISGTIRFGVAVPAEKGDVRINEILFNPFSGGADFVEVANVSEKVLDLSEMLLAEIDLTTGELDNIQTVAEAQILLLPGELVCLTADVEVQRRFYSPPDTAHFFQMASFPSYADGEGAVILYTSRDTMDQFFYQDDFHFPTLASFDGVSLERISLTSPTQDPGNWHSASAAFHFATPGYINSQARTPIAEVPSAISLRNTTFSPNGDGDEDVLEINYDFDFIGANVRITIFDSQGRQVRTLQNNQLLDPQPGSFFWDGRDDANNKLPVGMYIVVFEVLNQQSGEKEVYREVVVLADRL